MVTIVHSGVHPARWWQHLLHNQTALLIKGALLFRKRVVVVDVPFHLAPKRSPSGNGRRDGAVLTGIAARGAAGPATSPQPEGRRCITVSPRGGPAPK